MKNFLELIIREILCKYSMHLSRVYFCIYFIAEENRKEKEKSMRKKRSDPKKFKICKGYSPFTTNCAPNDRIIQCKFVSKACVYWVTCEKPIEQLTNNGLADCSKLHKWNSFLCCRMTCPT